MPACFAKRNRSAYTAGIVPLPGSAMPIASLRQDMEFAVNMPEQEPQPGQALFSQKSSSSCVAFPALNAPTASNTLLRSRFFPPL